MLAIAGQTAESNLLVVTPWVPWGNKGLSLKFDFFQMFFKIPRATTDTSLSHIYFINITLILHITYINMHIGSIVGMIM